LIRLYGQIVGEGSFVQVTRGMHRALQEQKRLAGLFAIDSIDEQEMVDGADALVALACGNPTSSTEGMHLYGSHAARWLLLAPNSSVVPRGIVDFLLNDKLRERYGAPVVNGLVAPSHWAKGVLRRSTGLPTIVIPHGVNPDVHTVNPYIAEARLRDYDAGKFRVLHFTSTIKQRKGTMELLRAWKALQWSDAMLAIVASPQYFNDFSFMIDDAGLTPDEVYLHPGFSATPEQVALRMQHAHVVCQPSRAEGFGLTPLEARACGVPVVMTNCTGHTEHVACNVRLGDPPGVIIVPHGDEAPIDDAPDAVAPTILVADIVDALEEARSTYRRLHEQSLESANHVRWRCAWENITREGVTLLLGLELAEVCT
jgi:glycosyltransferase involved in cell wall biosynthesis